MEGPAKNVFANALTKLVNHRMGEKNIALNVNMEETDMFFKISEMDRSDWEKLCFVMAAETTEYGIGNTDMLSLKKVSDFKHPPDFLTMLIEEGFISCVWKEMPIVKKWINCNKDPPEDYQEIPDDNGGLRSTFLKCLRIDDDYKVCTEDDNEVVEKTVLVFCFNLDKIAKLQGFAELDIFPDASKCLMDGLSLTCRLISLPVKPCRRKDTGEVWCQLQCKCEAILPPGERSNVAEFATRYLGRTDRRLPQNIEVYFAFDDAVDLKNPWGSCPLLQVGSNVKTPDFSRCFEEVGKYGSINTPSNTCFMYSQKNPTIEIPSKIKTEANIVMNGILDDIDNLFGDQRAPSNKLLSAGMGMIHPKSRCRHVGNAFFTFYLTRIEKKNTTQCSGCHVIDVGSDALIQPPKNVDDGTDIVTISPQKNTISRKVSIASYECMACPEKDKCTEGGAYKGFAQRHTVLPVTGNKCTGNNCNKNTKTRHLSHSSDNSVSDILSGGGKVCKALSNMVGQPSRTTSTRYTSGSCDRGAICHNFFCHGVVPCTAPFSPPNYTENHTLALFGKPVDVLNRHRNPSWTTPVRRMRRRIFFDKDDNNISEKAIETAFKDIVVYECDADRVRHYMDRNNIKSTACWKELVDLTSEFNHKVGVFYRDLVACENDTRTDADFENANACKILFHSFYKECSIYQADKRALLSGKKKTNCLATETDMKLSNKAYYIFEVLREHFNKNEAATGCLLHKNMLLGSRTIVSGARCVVNKVSDKWDFDVRQYVVVMAGSVIAPVSSDDLEQFTPVKGAVSATTAPNDKLPDRAHLTWDDERNATLHLDQSTPSSKCDNWRTAQKPISRQAFNTLSGRRITDPPPLRFKSSFASSQPSANRYVLPQLRCSTNTRPNHVGNNQ
uniref:Uncharacterized protein n=1 Tax=Chionoecetes opilio bacilliform virus TaxID=1825681 RepID=A0A1Q3DKW9_9VIRU|nr:wsv119-like protein [Chionoecetes opilio bacilliform virus]GAV93150.1 hypothetical protein SCV_026 [Chionoecetes opilio bacilliform virus]